MFNLIDVIMCVKNPDIEIMNLSVKKIKQQPEVRRILYVVNKDTSMNPLDLMGGEEIRSGFTGTTHDCWIPEEKSLSYARMLGIKYSQTPFISFVDYDVLIPKNFYRKCLKFMEKYPKIGGANGISMDTDFPRHGIKLKWTSKMVEIQRGLCTANIIRRNLVTDWNPPANLHALEDFHMAQYIRDQGYKWMQLPIHVYHLSFGEDFVKRWLWNGAGFRMIKEIGLGEHLPKAYKAKRHAEFLYKRFFRILISPVFYLRYGLNAKAIKTEVHRQLCIMIGYFKYHKYTKTRRTGYERTA
jgi:hypothetical protein